MYTSELKIPESRVAVLIGTKGETKRLIQRKTKTKLDISKKGDVVIECEDTLLCYVTESIVKSIGRGFNPNIALTLLNEDNILEIIDITDFAGKSKKKLTRLRSRLIGTHGKAKIMIEKLTGTDTVIQGKTICIIGNFQNVPIARQAIEKLLSGSVHGKVYMFIENQKRNLAKQESL